jgi:hypothetical protein
MVALFRVPLVRPPDFGRPCGRILFPIYFGLPSHRLRNRRSAAMSATCIAVSASSIGKPKRTRRKENQDAQVLRSRNQGPNNSGSPQASTMFMATAVMPDPRKCRRRPDARLARCSRKVGVRGLCAALAKTKFSQGPRQNVREPRRLLKIDFCAVDDLRLQGLALHDQPRRLADQSQLTLVWPRRAKVQSKSFAEITITPRLGGAAVDAAKQVRSIRDPTASCERPSGKGRGLKHSDTSALPRKG